jgi:purine-nucleoside/S-methyl-5'-thioadenosine phosphorylase / adenosine deaminase
VRCAGTGDALVATSATSCLAVLTADCAPLALGSDEGVFAAVHGGWRGLLAGVVEATVAAMRALGATAVVGALGPCVHPECYAFSAGDLDRVAARYGDGVRSTAADGAPALDRGATVRTALESAGGAELVWTGPCTGCGGTYFSHRARGDGGRQALLVWRDAAGGER